MAAAAKKSTSTKTKSKGGDSAALQQLKADLSAGTLDTLYFFYGEEDYLRDYYLNKLKETLLAGGMEAFNLRTFHGKECTPEALSDAVDCLPMMSDRSVIVVYDFDVFKANADQQEAFADILENLPEYVCLVFLYDLITIDKRTIKGRLGKLVKDTGRLVQFNQQSTADLVNWIRRRFKALGKEIDNTQANYLILVSGGLMTNLASEIEKIGAYAKGPSITHEDIDGAAAPVLDAVVFKMTAALSEGKFDEAALILGDLFAMQEMPVVLLGAIGRQLRQLYTARLAVENGKSAAWLVEIWSMKQSWSAERLLRNARHFPAQWYRTAVKLAGDADRAMKTSFNDGEAILIELLAKLAEAAR